MNTREINDMFKALTTELVRVEMEIGHIVIDQANGVVWWPKVWLDTMQTPEWVNKLGFPELAPEHLANLHPLTEENLAPMSEKLKELAHKLHLPLYEGKGAEQALPPTPEQIKMALKEAQDAHPRKRCPNCGSWMKYMEVLMWEQSVPRNDLMFPTPDECTGPLTCPDCKYRDVQ